MHVDRKASKQEIHGKQLQGILRTKNMHSAGKETVTVFPDIKWVFKLKQKEN